MPRIARVVVAGRPHRVTQRGVRSMRLFFVDEGRRSYLDLVREQFDAHHVEVRTWCLMTNHVHLIAVPETEDGLAKAMGRVHQHYTRGINFRQNKRGKRSPRTQVREGILAPATSGRTNPATYSKAGSTPAFTRARYSTRDSDRRAG